MLQLVEETLENINIPTSEQQKQMLLRYCDLVLTWNSRVNITGAKDLATFIEGPLFDALTLVPVFERAPSLVDIGSGGGLPAVPLSILFPDTHVTMVEPRGKRATFLKMIVDTFELNGTVHQTQDRELKQSDFDGASAQAVFPPKKWIGRARQLIRSGGAIYTLTSEEISESIVPNRVHIECQMKFVRNNMLRYAGRLRKTAE